MSANKLVTVSYSGCDGERVIVVTVGTNLGDDVGHFRGWCAPNWHPLLTSSPFLGVYEQQE